ncbi:MAG: glycosyltransferase family 4 protein [Thermococcus sp.]|nr:glycosyltransferase family 4 protein [Thermococcus sp.]
MDDNLCDSEADRRLGMVNGAGGSSERMNVLVLAQRAFSARSLVPYGGVRAFHEHARRWVRAGCSVKVIAPFRGKEEPREEEVDGVEVERCGGLANAIPTMWRAYRAYDRWADVVVENLLSYPLQTPLYVRHPLAVFSYHLMGSMWFRTVGIIKGTIGYCFEQTLPRVYRKTSFIAINTFHKKQLISQGLCANNIKVIYPGVDTTYFTPGEKSPFPMIFFVGSFQDGRKRVDHLVESYRVLQREFTDLVLVIAGGGGHRERKLRQLIHDEPNIRFVGRADEATKRDLYRKAWVYVNPSLMEGQPLSVWEANACGTPVVAYEIPGQETVLRNQTGLLAERGSPLALAQAIRRLLVDPNLRVGLGEHGVEHANRMSWDKAASTSLELLERMARRR